MHVSIEHLKLQTRSVMPVVEIMWLFIHENMRNVARQDFFISSLQMKRLMEVGTVQGRNKLDILAPCCCSCKRLVSKEITWVCLTAKRPKDIDSFPQLLWHSRRMKITILNKLSAILKPKASFPHVWFFLLNQLIDGHFLGLYYSSKFKNTLIIYRKPSHAKYCMQVS